MNWPGQDSNPGPLTGNPSTFQCLGVSVLPTAPPGHLMRLLIKHLLTLAPALEIEPIVARFSKLGTLITVNWKLQIRACKLSLNIDWLLCGYGVHISLSIGH